MTCVGFGWIHYRCSKKYYMTKCWWFFNVRTSVFSGYLFSCRVFFLFFILFFWGKGHEKTEWVAFLHTFLLGSFALYKCFSFLHRILCGACAYTNIYLLFWLAIEMYLFMVIRIILPGCISLTPPSSPKPTCLLPLRKKTL